MRDPLRAGVRVTAEADKDYADPGDPARHMVMWIEEGLEDRGVKVTAEVLSSGGISVALLREAADDIDAETRKLKADGILELDKFRPCRDASAQLRRKALEIETAIGECPQCGTTGACNGGPCALAKVPEDLREPDNPAAQALAVHIADHPVSTIQAAFRELGWRISFEIVPEEAVDESPMSTCVTCGKCIGWVDCPTGGWWAHEVHPGNDHLAVPSHCGCPAALLPWGDRAAERCVVKDGHLTHRTRNGESWTDSSST